MSDPNSGPSSRYVNGYIHADQMLHREITELRQTLHQLEHTIAELRRELSLIQRELEDARPHIESAQNARGTIVSIQVLAQLATAIGALTAIIYGAGNVLGTW